MKIVVLEPGYDHAHAHHQHVDFGIAESVRNRGGLTMIVAASNLSTQSLCACADKGVNVVPFFQTPCYPAEADRLPERQYEVLTSSFEQEVICLYETGILKGDENLVFHTGYSFHVLGLAKALLDIKVRITGRVFVSMMFHPGARVQDIEGELRQELFDIREYRRYCIALEHLHSLVQSKTEVIFATSCQAYRRVYQTIWPGSDVKLHPAVGFRPVSKAPSSLRNGLKQVLLYLGGPKDNKGFVFSAHVGSACAKAMPGVHFVFHFNNDFPGADGFLPIVRTLVEVGKINNNVEVIWGNIDEETYDKTLAQSDLICLFYDPAEYLFKTSGVFWDVLRYAHHDWVVTANTWIAAELAELNLPHRQVYYGDVGDAVKVLKSVLTAQGSTRRQQYPAEANHDYLHTINQSFGSWVVNQFDVQQLTPRKCEIRDTNHLNERARGRILVIRTQYGHFGPLSGPGGFVPWLRAMAYNVDEWLVPLGAKHLTECPDDLLDRFNELVRKYLQSYQGNSAITESEIQRNLCTYDIVHFLDAEHCGVLSALARIARNTSPSFQTTPKLVASFHQPVSILKELISNSSFLNGFDCIHLFSPCQTAFFEPLVDKSVLRVVPHGLAPELLLPDLPDMLVGTAAPKIIPDFGKKALGRKILLTVGNWLRDFDALLETAKLMESRNDLLFVLVSKGIQLEESNSPNVCVLNQGISDTELHALYLKADALFLPLKDSAANNAILEAMAHGLPIISTDLPAIRYYTQDLTTLVPPSPEAYVGAITDMLGQLANSKHRQELNTRLRTRASELTWPRVAEQMHRQIYSTLIPIALGTEK